jgi:hypothetical protein
MGQERELGCALAYQAGREKGRGGEMGLGLPTVGLRGLVGFFFFSNPFQTLNSNIFLTFQL